jgi:hypothetical protein
MIVISKPGQETISVVGASVVLLTKAISGLTLPIKSNVATQQTMHDHGIVIFLETME